MLEEIKAQEGSRQNGQSGQYNNNQPKRKQYQSCDHCRKRRRACDAITLGIDPFSTEARNESLDKACTTCKKSGIQCTFKWLRVFPRKNLPQGIKNRLKATHGLAPSDLTEDQKEAGEMRMAQSSQSLPGYRLPMTFELSTTNYDLSLAKDTPMSFECQNDHHAAWNPLMHTRDLFDNDSSPDQQFHAFTDGAEYQVLADSLPLLTTKDSSPSDSMQGATQEITAIAEESLLCDEDFTDSIYGADELQLPSELSLSRRQSYSCDGADERQNDIFGIDFFRSQTMPEIPDVHSDVQSFARRRSSQPAGSMHHTTDHMLSRGRTSRNVLAGWMSRRNPTFQRKSSIEEELESDDPCFSLLGAGAPGFTTT